MFAKYDTLIHLETRYTVQWVQWWNFQNRKHICS